jgi:hypothetical protein
MPEKKKFNIGNIVFWLSFSFFFFFILFNIAEDLFDKEGIAEKLFPLPEESPPIDTVFCDKIINRLEWTSYEGRNFKIEYVLCSNDFEDSQNFRNNMTVNNDIGEYYHAILTQDQMAMKKIVDAYRFIIRSQNLDYMEAAEMIVSSIQNIPYTLVIHEPCPYRLGSTLFDGACEPLENMSGCCGNVMPIGCYSPLEYAANLTGDCDTRAVFAFSILKALNYNVAIIVSRMEGHAMIALNTPFIPENGNVSAYVLDLQLNKYYFWELTSVWPFGSVSDKTHPETWEIVHK